MTKFTILKVFLALLGPTQAILVQANDLPLRGVPERAVIAHRGASHLAPESTIPAYVIASALGSHYLEADVRLTLDNEIVIFHDDDICKTTNVKEIDDPFFKRLNPKEVCSKKGQKPKEFQIEHIPFAELRKLDIGSWFEFIVEKDGTKKPNPNWRESYRNQKILKLKELMDLATILSSPKIRPSDNPVRLYLETKYPEKFMHLYGKLELAMINLIKSDSKWSLPDGKLVFQTFEKPSLKVLHKHLPLFPKVFLFWYEKDSKKYLGDMKTFGTEIGKVIEMGALGIGPDLNNFILKDTHTKDATGKETGIEYSKEKKLQDIKDKNVAVHVYTLNTVQEYQDLDTAIKGVKQYGVFTDRPELLLGHWEKTELSKEKPEFFKGFNSFKSNQEAFMKTWENYSKEILSKLNETKN